MGFYYCDIGDSDLGHTTRCFKKDMSHVCEVHVAIIRSERRTVGFALHVWCTTMCEIIALFIYGNTCNWLSIEHISEDSPTKNSVMTF